MSTEDLASFALDLCALREKKETSTFHAKQGSVCDCFPRKVNEEESA